LGLFGLWGIDVTGAAVRGLPVCWIAGLRADAALPGRIGGAFRVMAMGLSGRFVGSRVQ